MPWDIYIYMYINYINIYILIKLYICIYIYTGRLKAGFPHDLLFPFALAELRRSSAGPFAWCLTDGERALPPGEGDFLRLGGWRFLLLEPYNKVFYILTGKVCMGGILRLLFGILLITKDYAFTSEKSSTTEGQSTCALVPTSHRGQDTSFGRPSKSVWDPECSSFQRQQFPEPHCGSDGSFTSGLEMQCMLENQQGQHTALRSVWHILDAWERPDVCAPEDCVQKSQ